MNNEYYESNDQYRNANPVPPAVSRPVRIAALAMVIGMGVVVFGVACTFGGMHLMKYIERIEQLEKGGGRSDVFRSYPPRDAARGAVAEPAPAQAAGASQPQIYFMMGPGQQQAVPSYLQPNMQTDMNQFVLNQYQAEFAEYMRQRTMQDSMTAMSMPRRSGADFHSVPNMAGAPAAVRRQSYVSTDIAVPAKMTLDLKRRYSRDLVVEDWLKDEVVEQQQASIPTPLAGEDEGHPRFEPDVDAVLRSLAESTFADGRYDRTSRVYAELASRGVSLSVHELMRWAKATELAGDRESAVRILELILKTDPENIEVLKDAAALMVADKRFSVAAEYYRRLAKLEPAERDWRIWLAKTLTWSNRGEEAIEILRELYAESTGDNELNLMLAELLLSQHQFEEALPILDALIAADKTDDSLKVRKMNALMGLHKFAEGAEVAADLLTRYPEDTDLMLKQAVNLVAAGKFAESVRPFTSYLGIKPEDIEVRKQLAEAHMAAQQFSAAAVQYRMISDVEVANDEIRKKLANAHMAAQEWRQSAAVYSELAQAFPGDAEINMGLVISLIQSDDKPAALEAAKRYLQHEPFDAKMLAQAADLAMENKSGLQDAMGWYRTAVKLDPSNAKARFGFADALIWDMQYEAAEGEYRRALLFDGNNFKGQRGLARALFYQRKYKESFKIYKSLAWEDPTGSIVEEYNFREAIASGREDEACKVLLRLQEMEPEDITWKGDRYQSLLRQHRWPEARAQARVVVEQDRNHRATRVGHTYMNNYLTQWPVTLRGGLLRKSSKSSSNEQDDRKAKLTYTYYGVHGEKSVTDFVRAYADLDREKFNMREKGVGNLTSYKLQLGAKFEGHPNITGSADLGYRWFIGSDKKVHDERRGVDDQWLYNLRADMKEIAGTSLRVGVYSNRREHYDNYRNAYDNLYGYNFGLDASYRWRKWDFFTNLRSTVLTDNNTAVYFHFDTKYRLYETPCMLLTVGGNVEYEGWNETRDTYYSPKDQSRIGVEVDGRYWLCRDPEVWGSPQTYIDFGLSVYRDRFSNMGQKVYLGFNHDVTTRFSMFARADFNRESYYNEVKLFAGLTYKFGGCK